MQVQAPSLWLLRHAQPLIAPGVCYGQLDVAADPQATAQAAQRFGALHAPGTTVRVSPLQRCVHLARALPVEPASLILDPRLQEMHFGHWEGRSWNDIERNAVDAWSQDLYNYAPGNGESLRSMLQRVRSALLYSWQHDSLQGKRNVIWVTHAGVIRCVQWLLHHGEAQPHAADWNLPAPAFGQSLCLHWENHANALHTLQATH